MIFNIYLLYYGKIDKLVNRLFIIPALLIWLWYLRMVSSSREIFTEIFIETFIETSLSFLSRENFMKL